jgi:hypothetical protein
MGFKLAEAVWLDAGRRFAHYAKRRRRTSRESPKRLLADFIIGSHALIQADRLMTLDPKPDNIVIPSGARNLLYVGINRYNKDLRLINQPVMDRIQRQL